MTLQLNNSANQGILNRKRNTQQHPKKMNNALEIKLKAKKAMAVGAEISWMERDW